MTERHLESAARALEAVLNAATPEHRWVVSVQPPDGGNRVSTFGAVPIVGQNSGTETDNPNAVTDLDVAATADLPDQDPLEKAA